MTQQKLRGIAEYIWVASERIAHTLRNSALAEISKNNAKKFDNISSKQSHMLIAIRSLCEDYPDGISLKHLAKHLRVTPASASVMVDALMSNGYLIREISSTDRRTVRIRLSEISDQFYSAADRAIQSKLCSLAEIFGEDFLLHWHDLLRQVEGALVRPDVEEQ